MQSMTSDSTFDDGASLAERVRRQEFLNTVTHALGLLLAVAAAPAVILIARHRSPWELLAASVYVVSLVLVYAMSTLSHVFHFHATLRRVFRMLDQGCIYLLIAGTYTPFAAVYFYYGWWPLLTAAMWGTAIVGFVSKVLLGHRVESVALWAYVAMGWMPIVTVPTALAIIPSGGLWLMLSGGLCYTIGTVFLMLDGRAVFFHAIWHLLVIAGSACHYAAIIEYVLPTV